MNSNVRGEVPGSPCLKTLVQSGSVQRFENQFSIFEKDNKNKLIKHESNPQPNPTMRQTITETVLKSLDMSVNPCDNFFKFACGGYIKETNPPSGDQWAFGRPRNRIRDAVKAEIQSIVKQSDQIPLKKAKQLFQSCMDQQTIEIRGVEPILKYLSALGGWPVLGTWDSKNFDYIDLLAATKPVLKDWQFHYQMSGVVIGMTVQKDFGEKGPYAIYLDQPRLGQFDFSGLPNQEVYRLGRHNLYNKAYEEYLVDVAVSLGAHPNIAKKDMCDVVEFETALAKIMLFEEERRLVNIRYNKISILEMSIRYPKIDWLRFLRKILAIANIHVTYQTKVVLWASPYFDQLSSIITKTSKRTLANYILFRAIQPLLPSVSKNLQYVNLRYIATVNGLSEPKLPQRSDFCTDIVIEQMDWVTSRIFIENKTDSDQTLAYVNEIRGYVRFILTDMISKSKWLSDRTKSQVLKKILSVEDKLGFPEEILHDSFLDFYYRHFDMGKYFFENMVESLTENYKIVLLKLTNPPKNEWLLRPGAVNAWHNLATTSIEIPLGIMSDPFFENYYSHGMNFGGIGFLIGHEYAHGFEVIGMKFDWNGLIRRYWSDKSAFKFADKADCYVRQYSQYYIPEADVYVTNGNKTLNENLCDNIGVRAAFYAYKKFKHDRNISEKVPGLPFTDDQLFFINMARIWCSNSSPLFIRKVPLIDHHTLPRLRVIGPLQNSPEFASTFQCPRGSFMNPINKCGFW
ncbi:MMEL1 [Mytilus coruscus]|uniref:MMEL1 n=1 Tax=Mytilus coruscus TaxID=42192 RepID=A0A6J8E2Z8_MYTCO|nr:MMEL1 [Mytilus coruscus]